MGKNFGPGGKNRRKGKSAPLGHKRELRFREEGEYYGRVEKMLGDCRVDCICSDGVHRIAHIRGKFRKRVWITTGDVILLSLREFQDEKADVVHKYNAEEIAFLTENNEIRFQESSTRNQESLMQDLLHPEILESENVEESDVICFDDI